MQTQTRYQVEARYRYESPSHKPGAVITGTRREFRTLKEAREYERRLGIGESYTVHVHQIIEPANRVTLTLNPNQIHALYSGLQMAHTLYEGYEEEDLADSGIDQILETLHTIKTKLDRATGNN